MRDKRVLVVGDVMLDEFVWGKVSRISPEAPVPVVQVTGQSFHLGGAGNVAANVRTLGGAAALVGLVGRDAAAAGVDLSLPLDASRSTGRPGLNTYLDAQLTRADNAVDPPPPEGACARRSPRGT